MEIPSLDGVAQDLLEGHVFGGGYQCKSCHLVASTETEESSPLPSPRTVRQAATCRLRQVVCRHGAVDELTV